MIYANCDFTKNFLNAVGYDDKTMITDMVNDELARLIVERKKDVVALLRSEKVNASVNDSNPEIANYVVDEIKNKNPNVIKKISQMITFNRLDEITAKTFKEKYQNAIGNIDASVTQAATSIPTTETKTTFWQNLGSIFKNEQVQEGVSTIVANVLTDAFSKGDTASTTANQDALNERLYANEMYLSAQAKSRKTWTIVGIVAGVAVLTIVTIIIVKGKKQPAVEPTV